MGNIENVYRVRRKLLYGMFICSILLFFVILSPGLNWRIVDWKIGVHVWPFLIGVILVVIGLALFVRYIHLRILLKKNPSLIRAAEDERIHVSWLKAFRFTFYVLIAIHLSYNFNIYFTLGKRVIFIPHPAWLSLAVAFPLVFGASLFFSREGKNNEY